MAKDQLKPGEGVKKLCKKCGERETLSKSCPYCARCMGDIARDKKKAPQAPVAKPPKIMGDHPAMQGKACPGAITAVTIDFKSYPDLLRSIEGLATEEVRPLDLQIIYLLKSRVRDIGI